MKKLTIPHEMDIICRGMPVPAWGTAKIKSNQEAGPM
jgi:hypothetical protein